MKLVLGYMEEGAAMAPSEIVLVTYGLRGDSLSVTCVQHTQAGFLDHLTSGLPEELGDGLVEERFPSLGRTTFRLREFSLL